MERTDARATVLILGRGDTAGRVISACRQLGLRSVVTYTDSEIDDAYVRAADAAYALHDTSPDDQQFLIDLGSRVADAIHPAGSPLNLDASFVRRVAEAGLAWVGASERTLQLMQGLRPSERPVATVEDVETFVQAHGLPVELHLAGEDPRVIFLDSQIGPVFRMFPRPHPSEIRVRPHLPERRHLLAYVERSQEAGSATAGVLESLLERRGTPLAYEAPADIGSRLLAEVASAAEQLAEAVELEGVATAEYALAPDAKLRLLRIVPSALQGCSAFEEGYRLDLVERELQIALRLPGEARRAPPHRHALQFTLHAEDPARGFLPAAGVISAAHYPGGPGVRVDIAADIGAVIDENSPVIAHLTVSGATRQMCIERAQRALAEIEIDGVSTTAPFLVEASGHPDFISEGNTAGSAWDVARALRIEPSAQFSDVVPIRSLERWPILVGGRPMTLVLSSVETSTAQSVSPHP